MGYFIVLMSSLLFYMSKIVKIKKRPGMSRYVQTFDWYCTLSVKGYFYLFCTLGGTICWGHGSLVTYMGLSINNGANMWHWDKHFKMVWNKNVKRFLCSSTCVLRGNCPITPPIQQHRPRTIHYLSRVHIDIGKSNSRTFRDFFMHLIVIFTDLNVIQLYDLHMA
jgi:hypothetical protein